MGAESEDRDGALFALAGEASGQLVIVDEAISDEASYIEKIVATFGKK